MEDSEPPENISGGPDGGGVSRTDFSSDATTRTEAVVNRLGELYWQKEYGGQDAFQCLVRTVLSQNTSDKASQPAFDALCDRYDTGQFASALAGASHDAVAGTIQPAGLYNQKASVIIQLADWVVSEYGSADAFDSFIKTTHRDTVRDTLLSQNGIGPKTADCVLLFAAGKHGVFPVDTHVYRLYRRLGVVDESADHEAVRAHLEETVPGDKCGFGHTASIQFGREYCTARNPVCVTEESACPLRDLCEQVGVTEPE